MASMLESAAPAVPSLALPQPAQTDAVDAAFQRAAAERHARATPVRGAAVLRFTTLSNDAPRRGFVIGDCGTVGRGAQNHIQVASDATLCETNHGTFRRQDNVLILEPGNGVVAVRCSTGESTDYPLRTGCEFGCGSSIFAVSRDAPLALYCREGPLQGRTLDVREALTCVEIKQRSYGDNVASMAWGARNLISTQALTIGRAASCDATVEDRELSRQHCKVQKRSGVYYLVDLGSTNGTYVRRVGPYAGPHRLRIGDKILLGRTGLELCRFDVGICSLKGARRTMEDRTTIVHDLRCSKLPPVLQPVFFAAVFDGHGGDACAQFLKNELHGYVRRSLDAQSDWSNAETTINAALRDACLQCDAAFLATNPANRAGSTACILLVFGQSIMSCANVGDSRCCLATASGCAQLSEDQTPARADEAQRIRDAGGFVIHKRVMGELAVSRAFGDAELKRPVHELVRPNEPAPAEAGPRMVLAEPEVSHRAVEGDFALIACDGLYDVFSSDEAVDVVRKGLVENAGDPVRAAAGVCSAAVDDRGSRDNVTAVVVALRAAAPEGIS